MAREEDPEIDNCDEEDDDFNDRDHNQSAMKQSLA